MQKGTAALFLLITGFLIVGLVGFFSFGLFKPQTSLPSLKNPISFSKPLTDNKPKFLTYSNQNLRLQFQYPDKDFAVKEDSEEDYNKRGNGNFRKNFTGYVGYEPGEFLGAVVVLDKSNSYEANPFSIWVFNNNNNLTIEQWFQNYWYYPFLWGVFDYTSKVHITPDQEATISGQTGKSKIVTYQLGSPKYLYLSNSDKMYLFRIIGETGDKILSTFKFLP